MRGGPSNDALPIRAIPGAAIRRLYRLTFRALLLLDDTMKTIDEINQAVTSGALKKIKTSMWRGYVSRKGKATAAHPYKGKYGSGFCVYSPNYDSTRYSFITYYVEVKP